MNISRLLALALVALTLLLPGCIFEAPITEKPTRKIDERLLGDWIEGDDANKHLTVYKLNDSEFIVEYDKIMYHAYHSEFEGQPFVSVQNISAIKEDERRWAFLAYELQDNGAKLVLRTLNMKVVPETLHTTAEIQESIKKNLKDPKFFNEDKGVFNRPK